MLICGTSFDQKTTGEKESPSGEREVKSKEVRIKVSNVRRMEGSKIKGGIQPE